jgi:hypothetical protein
MAMKTVLTNNAYRIAIVLAGVGLVVALFLLKDLVTLFWTDLFPPANSELTGEGDEASPAIEIVFKCMGALIALLGASSMALLGWRRDRREVLESNLKIMKLEVELARLNAATGANATP